MGSSLVLPLPDPQQWHLQGLKVKSSSWVLHIQAFNRSSSLGAMGPCEPLEGSLSGSLNLGSYLVRKPRRSSDWDGEASLWVGTTTLTHHHIHHHTHHKAHFPGMPEPSAGGEAQETLSTLGISLPRLRDVSRSDLGWVED